MDDVHPRGVLPAGGGRSALDPPPTAFLCKKCKRAFRKQVEEFEEADEYCPHCDNHFIIEAKTRESQGRLVVEV